MDEQCPLWRGGCALRGVRGGARNPHWWDLDTPKVFRSPGTLVLWYFGTNFRYRREPPSNFSVCPLFGTPPSIGAPGDLEKPPKSASFCYEDRNTESLGPTDRDASTTAFSAPVDEKKKNMVKVDNMVKVFPLTFAYCKRNNFWQSSNMAVQNGFISRGSSGLPQLFRVAELFRARKARPEPAKT